ncbi:MAG: hypothetical protein WA771_07325, partial [Chthoniobacterales bacterium]
MNLRSLATLLLCHILLIGSAIAGGGGLDLEALVDFTIAPDDDESLTVESEDGEESGCPVKVSITVEGEVEANGGTEGFFDEVVLTVNDTDHTLFAGDDSGEENWSTDDPFNGVTKQESVEVTLEAGDEVGLKYLTRNDYWNDGFGAKIVSVEPVTDDCETSCEAGGGEPQNGCVSLRLLLGSSDDDEASAGNLLIEEETPTADLATPNAIRLASGLYGRTRANRSLVAGQTPEMVVFDQNGDLWDVTSTGSVIRQVLVPDALVDIVTLSATKYEVRFYRRSEVGPRGGNGLYTLNGNAQIYEKWTIENPDVSGQTVDQLKITNERGARVREFLYEWIPGNGAWTLTKGTGAEAIVLERIKTVLNATDSDNRLVTKNALGDVAFVRGKVKRQFSFGDFVIESYRGSGSDRSTTTYEYWPDGSGANTGKLRRVTSPSGRWVYFHLYDAQGRVLQKVAQLKDAPYTGTWPDSVNKAFSYT